MEVHNLQRKQVVRDRLAKGMKMEESGNTEKKGLAFNRWWQIGPSNLDQLGYEEAMQAKAKRRGRSDEAECQKDQEYKKSAVSRLNFK